MELSLSIITVLLTLLAVMIGAGQYLRSNRISIFERYADKYNAIIIPSLYEDWKQALAGERAKWKELEPTMISYLNLIWEETYLRKERLISPRLFEVWYSQIESTLNSEFAQSVISKYDYHFNLDELRFSKPTLRQKVIDFVSMY